MAGAAALSIGHGQFSIVGKSKCDRAIWFKVDADGIIRSGIVDRFKPIRNVHSERYLDLTHYQWNTPLLLMIGAIHAFARLQRMEAHWLSLVSGHAIDSLGSIDSAKHLFMAQKVAFASHDEYFLK